MTDLDEAQSQEPVLRTVSIEVSGPIPPPQVLQQYDRIVPNGADRIVRLAEDQIHHRHSMETRGGNRLMPTEDRPEMPRKCCFSES